MKAVIPAKRNSTRVPMKNYRPFYEGKSLVDILVEKLLFIFPPWDIHISCEDGGAERVAQDHGIVFHHRDKRLTENFTPLADVVRGICADIPGDDPIMWCECIDPLFDQHCECVDRWRDRQSDSNADSLVVVHPEQSYLLDADHQPIGFGFGPWHIPSQRLPQYYRLNFTCSILTRESIEKCGYMVGARPIWFDAMTPFIDIDTEEDFRLAQIIYAASRGDAAIP